MDVSSARWVSELGMEDYSLIHQYNLNSSDLTNSQDLATALAGGESYKWFSSSFDHKSPSKQFKTSSSTTTKHSNSSSSDLITFEHVTPKGHTEFIASSSGPNFVSENPKFGTSKRPYANANAQDHVMAERKRREKLSERFIALSAMIPGLKKMDKASVLGDALKYLKQLQERVKVLEEQNKKRRVESVVFVNKSQLSAGDDDESSCDENFDPDQALSLPEIEARVSDKDVLIRIHCEKHKGVVANMITQMESLFHLSVHNTTVLPFGNSTLDITIVAQMDDEFSMTVKDLVKNLRVALIKFL